MKKIVEIRLPKHAVQVTDHSFQLVVETFDGPVFENKFGEHLQSTLGQEETDMLVDQFLNGVNKRMIMKQVQVTKPRDIEEKPSSLEHQAMEAYFDSEHRKDE